MCMCLWWLWRQSQRTERRLWYRQRESPLSLSSHNSICGLKCWKPFYRCGLEPEIGPIKFNHYQIRWLTSQCDSAELCLECCCTWYYDARWTNNNDCWEVASKVCFARWMAVDADAAIVPHIRIIIVKIWQRQQPTTNNNNNNSY